MPGPEDEIEELLTDLSEARTWSARIKGLIENGVEVSREIHETDRAVENLKRRAGEAMKMLGCVSPRTRAIYHAMADMLISWYAFKETLE